MAVKTHQEGVEPPIPDDVQLHVGGDFNCTQLGHVDRSYWSTSHKHSCASLARLEARWNLTDTLSSRLPSDPDDEYLQWFYSEHHTYEYTVPGKGMGSSRLDRWHTNDHGRRWVADTKLNEDGLRTDHKGVELHQRSPANPFEIAKPNGSIPYLPMRKNGRMGWSTLYWPAWRSNLKQHP
ncbi:unnamed protein product [Phytophthora fragariaefolia]|uniref:Unnamed protein product n=1 Tax=Phytophthora fragariaefolia TaxID=1490495 RepID=A0A9W6Y8X0_9STRA|nr:unnamed protein product [Phytophthora fragariaefolia]